MPGQQAESPPRDEFAALYHAHMPNAALSLDRIEAASRLIDPVFRDTPHLADESLSRSLGREVFVKIETLTPVRSFKGRGADFLLGHTKETRTVVCASTGNFGRALAQVARRRGLGACVFAPVGTAPAEISRLRGLGVRVVVEGRDIDDARHAASVYTRGRGDLVLIEEGREARIAEGAGTIGVELAPLRPDTVLLPVGSGALAAGVGRWLKARSPRTRVIGVCAAGAPAMAHSWRAGSPMATAHARTFATSLAVRSPTPEAVEWMRDVVDDMLLVEEKAIDDALRLLRDTLGLLVEPAAAVGIAAVLAHDPPGARTATVLTGGRSPVEAVRAP
ncbi:pyridoxal-phosphate dependent enzyme [Marinactinospora endophytica]